MVEMIAEYQGQLSCTVTHGPSGCEIVTDAPKDNQGLGRSFSPTDLVGAALSSCILTIMGIYAQRHGIDLKGARANVQKEMATDPVRRVGKLTVKITLPKSVPAEHRDAIERAGRTCPVSQSLHAGTVQAVSVEYA
ncbi:MAG TPA: OsmC family protein [Planctomycetota bacterium]|nr:OsmC family protein [Planctomycetota bacterium]